MNDSNSSSNSTTGRPILKLKAGTRRPLPEAKAPAPPQTDAISKSKPGARWTDDYMQRMQADMDLLTPR
jgi:hypothetical protein